MSSGYFKLKSFRIRHGWRLGICALLAAVMVSCNQPRDRSSYSGDSLSYAQVSVRVDSRSNTRYLRSAQKLSKELEIPAPRGSALVIAVDSGTPFSEDYNSITGYYDKQLVDLATSTVTLTLPLNTPLQLFEYVFVKSYSLSNLGSENQPVFTKSILGPFTLTGSTTTLELEATLEFALESTFDRFLEDNTYMIEYDEHEGVSYYIYEALDWRTMDHASYVFNPDTGEFETGTSPRKEYELIDGDWVETSGHSPNATLDRVDRSSRTVYYSNPDFTATLTGLVDLTLTGFIGTGPGEGGEDGEDQGDSDTESGFMAAEDFKPGAIGYVLMIDGTVDAEYRLHEIATSHDCARTEYSSLGDFIDGHTTSEFTCQGYEGSSCLRFESYTPGQVTGMIIEVVRDETMTITGEYAAGTWEIETVQNKEMLFYYPDDTSYYEYGAYASFWSVLNGKVWVGYHPVVETNSEPMVVAVFNEEAIADYRRFLEAAPAEMFVNDHSESSICDDYYWDAAIWDNTIWAP